MKVCANTNHGGGSRSTSPREVMTNAWRCNHYHCGGIQAWRHHIEWNYLKNRMLALAEEHRWQRALGLPLTPIEPLPFGKYR